MSRRGDRDRAIDRIDAGVVAIFRDGGEAGQNIGAEDFPGIEKHPATRLYLTEIGAGDDVARRQLGIGMDSGHEPLAQIVDQNGTFAAQGFGGEWRRIGTGGDGGGVELDKFRIGNDGAGPGSHAHGVAAHAWRIGGHSIEPTQATGGQYSSAGADKDGFGIAVAQAPAIDADNAAIVARQAQRRDAFHHADRRGAPDLGDDGLHDGPAGAVALDLDDAIG